MLGSVTTRIALRALAKNKMRAGLTVLGVVIGIAAVTALVSVGMSASALVQGEFQNLGTNVIVVLPGNEQSSGGVRRQIQSLTPGDANSLPKECSSVLAATPVVFAAAPAVFGNSNWTARETFGVDENFPLVRNWQTRLGSFFTNRDVISAAKVCVIGQTVVKNLFQTSNPIGQIIRVRNIPFEVVGVLETKGANMVGEDQDDVLIMPYTTVRKRLQGSNFDTVNIILASARSSDAMKSAEVEMHNLLLDRHKIALGQSPDFEVANTTEIANVFGIITGTLTLMLGAIAGISLIVGGVGIMNIMLVSVTERTREIGIRMAVGARPVDILLQFLVESVVLSMIGGLIGILIGVGGSVGLTMLINAISSGRPWPIIVSFPAAIGALLFSAMVGIGFGFYPAWRASRLDPIDALRYE
ncbi:MAG: ABC transporter permease [Planctomycetales bacterium]|nr:ABC transporter permease [Planctomycetales bacterium]